MKYLIAGFVVVALGVTAYFIFNPGTRAAKREPVLISNDNPFFKPKPVDVPFNMDKAEFGRKLFAEGRYDDAVSVYSGIFSSSDSRQAKATALLMGAQSLMQADSPDARRYARQVYAVYEEQFSKEGNLDSVYYNLGLLALADADGPTALLHFTTLLQEYPESHFAANAALSAHQIAVIIERQNETLKGRVLRLIGPFLPTNSAALVGILTSLASVTVWFLYDWEAHYQKLIVKKDPVVWVLLIVFVVLAATNYLFEDRENAKSMLDATKALAARR